MTYRPDAPEGAVWFTLQRCNPRTRKFERVVKEWWSVEQEPASVAEQFGPGEYKAHYRDSTKAKNKGNGQSFWIEAIEGPEPEPSNSVDENNARAAAAAAAHVAATARQERAQQPPLPSAYAAPPLPPHASESLATHMFLHQMVRQDAQLLQQQQLLIHAQAMAGERARADAAVTSARDHYAAMLQATQATQAVVLELSKGQQPQLPPELVDALSNQSTALATIGARLDAADDADDRDGQLEQLLEAMQQGGDAEPPNTMAAMLQNFIPFALKAYEAYQQGQEPGAPAGEVVDTQIDAVDSAAE